MSCFKKLIILNFGMILIWGCADTTGVRWESSPSIGFRSNDLYYASIEPIIWSKGCVGFTLRIVNRSDKELELNWNNSFFIINGRPHGGFIFEGIDFKDIRNPRQPEVIPVNKSISKDIFPNNLVSFSDRKLGGVSYLAMSEGKKGVYLTVKAGDLQLHEKISVRLFAIKRNDE